jgi:hypothetical protein
MTESLDVYEAKINKEKPLEYVANLTPRTNTLFPRNIVAK